jgi:phage baseplate assembly protein W
MIGMIGLDRRTGQLISGLDHLRQSIEDILSTPLGSRRMRPEYGSKLRRFVDLPVNDGWKSAVQAEVASTLGRWEPRLKLGRVRAVAILDGHITFELTGQYLGSDVTLEVSA